MLVLVRKTQKRKFNLASRNKISECLLKSKINKIYSSQESYIIIDTNGKKDLLITLHLLHTIVHHYHYLPLKYYLQKVTSILNAIDHFQWLDLPITATSREDKLAYRRLSGIYHQDKWNITKSFTKPESIEIFQK